MEPQSGVPFMRSSATVRRKPTFSQQESHKSLSPERAGPSLDDILSSGPLPHEQKSSFKVGSHLSNDHSGAIDRKLGLLAVEAVTRNSSKTSDQDPTTRLQRVRSDLPDPRKLCTRAKRANTTKRKRHKWDISEHIAQLKHKCLDFSWGRPTVEIKNKGKPEEAVATVQRCNPKPTMSSSPGSVTSWVPRHPSDRIHWHAASSTAGPSLGDATEDPKALGVQRWTARPGITHVEPVDDEIPGYLQPPGKWQAHQQHHQLETAPVRDVPSIQESPFCQSFRADDKMMVTSSFVHAIPSDYDSRFIMKLED